MTVRSYDWIAHHAQVRPDKVAMVDLRTDRRITYAAMHRRVDQLCALLHRELGVAAGDRVAVYSHNDTNIFEVQFACWRLGAVFVPLNWRLTIPELDFIVGDCSPKAMLHQSEFGEEAEALCANAGISHRVSWDGPADGAADYEDALASVGGDFPRADNTHDTMLTVMYTSGTTGRPKGAIITHGMTFWNTVNITETFAVNSEMVNLVALPQFHTGGLNCFANPAFHFGGSNVVMHTFDPEHGLRVLADPELGVTHFLGVPANWLFMSQSPSFADARFPSLAAAGVGGSPTPVELIKTWLAKGVPLQQAFGMTETSPLVMSLTKADAGRRVGSAGLPALHTECRIVDELGNDVSRGDVGELWVRGPNVIPGYWNRPDATDESFTDGWLHTGDAARQDDEGYYYIVDRWKDMYISGGENVYPAEVENAIYQLPGIAEAAVFGVPDERWVEVGRAVVVRREGATLTESDVVRHCVERLAKFKVPKSVVFVDELPHNATGKILKRELRERYGKPIFAGPTP
ncbi:MAG TPA: long-chain fatty acid--CoA ligase [Acidimicrobiales bacterium]|nr:long-chain fatty acid--CoA ligase [Acidimicrobiales bacterium]